MGKSKRTNDVFLPHDMMVVDLHWTNGVDGAHTIVNMLEL